LVEDGVVPEEQPFRGAEHVLFLVVRVLCVNNLVNLGVLVEARDHTEAHLRDIFFIVREGHDSHSSMGAC
jgi:hypothetical protein